MNDDAALLRRYAEEGSEPAFTELVRRHADLVYGAALRRTQGDAHGAAEVAQRVFTNLARDARKLSRHTQLAAAWLHTATRNAALNLMISEQRRRQRETAALALELNRAAGETSPAWEQVQPLLDASIDELPETDRAAVVLRFLERRPFAEIGAALTLSEDAARMRTERALEKLRTILARHGITSTGAALGAVLTAQPLVSAPAGLATSLASGALTAGVAVASGAAFVSFMSTKLVTTVAVSALLAFGIGAYVGNQHLSSSAAATSSSESGQQSQTQAMGALRQDNQRLAAELEALKSDVARLRSESETANAAAEAAAKRIAALTKAATKSPNMAVPVYEVQTAVLNNLRQIQAARELYVKTHGHPPASLSEMVGAKAYIRTVRTVGGEDYSDLSMSTDVMTVTTPDGISVTYDPTGATTTKPDIPPEVAQQQKIQASVTKAVAAYRAANGGANPPNEAALVAYFATPQEGADFVEALEARKAGKK